MHPLTIKTCLIIFLTSWISYCNGQTGSQKPILVFKSKEQISQVVRTIFQDSKGNIWFGTQNGAFKQAGNSLIHIDSIKCELRKGVTIKDIVEVKNGKIWLGHSDGISSIDGDIVTNYYEADGLINNDVWCIETDINGNVWIGTKEGVCVFDGQTFTKFDLPEGERDTTVGVSSKKMVHSILQDSKGTMWFSTNAGLFSYSDTILVNVSEKIGIKTHFINEIVEDKKGTFWVSTKIGLYQIKGDTLTDVTEKHFGKSIGTGSIIEDAQGRIWFSCRRNVYCLHGDKLTDYKTGDANNGPLTFQIYEDQQDRLWFVGFGGAYRLENEKFINVTKDGPW